MIQEYISTKPLSAPVLLQVESLFFKIRWNMYLFYFYYLLELKAITVFKVWIISETVNSLSWNFIPGTHSKWSPIKHSESDECYYLTWSLSKLRNTTAMKSAQHTGEVLVSSDHGSFFQRTSSLPCGIWQTVAVMWVAFYLPLSSKAEAGDARVSGARWMSVRTCEPSLQLSFLRTDAVKRMFSAS